MNFSRMLHLPKIHTSISVFMLEDTTARWIFSGIKKPIKPQLLIWTSLLCSQPPRPVGVLPTSQRPGRLQPPGPPSLAAWLQLTCGMAQGKHLIELLLWSQKAISPNHSLLMPLTPGSHTHTHTHIVVWGGCRFMSSPLRTSTRVGFSTSLVAQEVLSTVPQHASTAARLE